jgi:hypothetical protein
LKGLEDERASFVTRDFEFEKQKENLEMEVNHKTEHIKILEENEFRIKLTASKKLLLQIDTLKSQ